MPVYIWKHDDPGHPFRAQLDMLRERHAITPDMISSLVMEGRGGPIWIDVRILISKGD